MTSKKAIKSKSEQRLEKKYERCVVLLNNLVRAAETHDTTALDQTAGAARIFLDKERYEE